MSSDQRRARRLRVPEGQNEAVLKTKGREVSVRLIDTSATGFLFTCSELSVQPGDAIQLFTQGGCFEVRVAFSRPGGEGCECGVERVRELVDEAAVHSTNLLHIVFPRYHNIGLVGTGGLLIVGGLLLGFIVIGALTLADSGSSKRSFGSFTRVRQFGSRVAENVEYAISSITPAPATAPQLPAPPAELPPSAVLFNRWRQDGGRQLAAELELTEEQIRKLGELFASHETTGDEVSAELASIEFRLTEILTDEQRAKVEAE